MENHSIIAKIDPEVLRVIDFMQHGAPGQSGHGIACSRLVAVAEAIGALGPILWAHHPKESLYAGAPITVGRSLAPSVMGGNNKLP
ncbi:hypothetical protein [Acetobacter sp.]|uniref:hypothetical protein n=1 Tax=Acetobacter sp. TaxID=440 RepID=UPI0039EAC635